jgi:hypothetical protein
MPATANSQTLAASLLGQMGLNDKISERFEIKVAATRQQIIDAILAGRQNQKNILSVDAFDYINYKKIKISGNRIETVQMPTILNPFRPHGRVTIDIDKDEPNQSILKCVILPSDGIFPLPLGLLIGFFTLWTAVGLLISRGDMKVLLLIIPGWLGFGLITYLGLLYNKSRLREYAKRLIKEITDERK